MTRSPAASVPPTLRPGYSRAMARILVCAVLLVVLATAGAKAGDPTPEIVRYEPERLTVRVTDVPLDRLLAQIAAVTKATIRGTAPPRPITVDFQAIPLREGLARIFGEESFMLTYANDGTLRTIDLLARGAGTPAPPPSAAPSPRPPLAEEEEQAAILRRTVPASGPLAGALANDQPTIGQVLHAVLREPRASVRAAAREEALTTFARDAEIAAAYLSTLTPVDDAVLAQMLRTSAVAEGSAEEWMAALATRAPSAALRQKASAVLEAMRGERSPF